MHGLGVPVEANGEAQGVIVKSVASVAPNPVSPFASWGLGGLSTLLAWLARLKSAEAYEERERADQTGGQADKSSRMLNMVILGVENENVA